MENRFYVLLASVGIYQNIKIKNLPSWEMDLKLMNTALVQGLMIPQDNIRILGENGTVISRNFAREIAEISKYVSEEDGFICYFSGHGNDRGLCFSDATVTIQSIIEFIKKIKAKSKIVIMDCCYSGNFWLDSVMQMDIEKTVSDFAGHGIAVMASSASNEKSWLGIDGTHSLYTGILTTAMTVNRKIRQGRVSLADINEEVKKLIKTWNLRNPDRSQHPIYRASLGGTIFFQVEEYKPYQTLQIYLEKSNYIIEAVEPVSSLKEKRLAVFILVKEKSSARQLFDITRNVVQEVKYIDVYSTLKLENIHGHKAADAIWCYFGYDESDMVNHRYFARSIWCSNRELRKKYFRAEKNAEVIRGIWIVQDSSYEMVRKLQQTTIFKEQFQELAKKLLGKTVSMAEQFIRDIEEIDNRTKTVVEVQREYMSWIRQVYEEYYKMIEIPVPPNELHDWFSVVEDLVGCVLDMALELRKSMEDNELDRWVIRNCVRRYYGDLERMKELESQICKIKREF